MHINQTAHEEEPKDLVRTTQETPIIDDIEDRLREMAVSEYLRELHAGFKTYGTHLQTWVDRLDPSAQNAARTVIAEQALNISTSVEHCLARHRATAVEHAKILIERARESGDPGFPASYARTGAFDNLSKFVESVNQASKLLNSMLKGVAPEGMNVRHTFADIGESIGAIWLAFRGTHNTTEAWDGELINSVSDAIRVCTGEVIKHSERPDADQGDGNSTVVDTFGELVSFLAIDGSESNLRQINMIQGALSDLLSAGQHDKIQISRTALCELLDERKVSEDRVVNTIGLENKKEQRFPACDRFCFTRERTEPYIPLSNLVSRAVLLEIAGEVK